MSERTIRAALAAGSHPSEDHHWVFTDECLDQIAEQATGLPVTINFSGDPIGKVTEAKRTPDGVELTMSIDCESVPKVASPQFRATEAEWDKDFNERLIQSVDFVAIGLTDD